MKAHLFALALACTATFAVAGDLTDSTDQGFKQKINGHIDSQIAAGKVVCDGLPKLDIAVITMCETLRHGREEGELDKNCRDKKLKGPAFKACAAPIRKKYRLTDAD